MNGITIRGNISCDDVFKHAPMRGITLGWLNVFVIAISSINSSIFNTVEQAIRELSHVQESIIGNYKPFNVLIATIVVAFFVV